MAACPGSDIAAGFPIRGWFADCDPEFRRQMLALARPKSCSARSRIYLAGEAGGDVFAVCAGVLGLQAKFTHPDAVLLHLLRPGDWFGTVPALVEHSRRVSIVARTDVELLRVPGPELRALLRQHPEWVAELGRDLVYYIDVLMQGAVDLLIRDASVRCAAILLRLAGRRWASGPDANLPADLPVSQSELAMNCNMSRNTLSRVLKDFSRRQLVTLGYRCLSVNDPARLRQLADR